MELEIDRFEGGDRLRVCGFLHFSLGWRPTRPGFVQGAACDPTEKPGDLPGRDRALVRYIAILNARRRNPLRTGHHLGKPRSACFDPPRSDYASEAAACGG